LAVGTYTASGNSLLAVGMLCAFYSQHDGGRYFEPAYNPGASGRGPTMSIPHFQKGHAEVPEIMSFLAALVRWHILDMSRSLISRYWHPDACLARNIWPAADLCIRVMVLSMIFGIRFLPPWCSCVLFLKSSVLRRHLMVRLEFVLCNETGNSSHVFQSPSESIGMLLLYFNEFGSTLNGQVSSDSNALVRIVVMNDHLVQRLAFERPLRHLLSCRCKYLLWVVEGWPLPGEKDATDHGYSGRLGCRVPRMVANVEMKVRRAPLALYRCESETNSGVRTLTDMTGIPRSIAEHELKTYPHIEPRVQRKRSIAPDIRKVVKDEVAVWLKAEIVRKDLYPLSEIDWKIESPMGFKYKCFLDAYKGLIDTIFEGQMGRNLEAYVDDMVIKSKTKPEMIKDVEETLLTLKKVNMKLNPKKCSFGMEEAKMALPCLDTLKKRTNKKDFHWTIEAEEAFREMKKPITELPTLTAPIKEEELMVYLSVANKAVKVVLLVERHGRQAPIHYEKKARKSRKLRNPQHLKIWGPKQTFRSYILTEPPMSTDPEQGMDIVRPLLEAPGKIKYLIVAIDFSTKLIKAKVVTSITGKQVKNFAFDNIVCRFGIPATIITDNGTQLINDPFMSWAEGLGIKLISTSVYHPQANGAVERANRSIILLPLDETISNIKGEGKKHISSPVEGWKHEVFSLPRKLSDE
nr:hypothetical protein [Tanacetum cinerariifolium]